VSRSRSTPYSNDLDRRGVKLRRGPSPQPHAHGPCRPGRGSRCASARCFHRPMSLSGLARWLLVLERLTPSRSLSPWSGACMRAAAGALCASVLPSGLICSWSIPMKGCGTCTTPARAHTQARIQTHMYNARTHARIHTYVRCRHARSHARTHAHTCRNWPVTVTQTHRLHLRAARRCIMSFGVATRRTALQPTPRCNGARGLSCAWWCRLQRAVLRCNVLDCDVTCCACVAACLMCHVATEGVRTLADMCVPSAFSLDLGTFARACVSARVCVRA
jgi:hypothetical protein